jgi:hypothetical protein
MEKDKNPDEIFSGTSPEYEVWIHISTGLDMARQELDSLSEKERAILTKFAEHFFSQRTKLTVDPEDTFAGLSQQLLDIPWLKFAADIAFAQEGVWRAERALDRYMELQPILTRYKLSDLASKYLQEAGHTFLFSFDAACVTFCNAALEQTLRDLLVDANVMTSRELQRTHCTANTLLERATQQHLLPQAAEQAARDLIAKRNRVMHRRFENLKEDALKAMENLGIVLQYLGRLKASDA